MKITLNGSSYPLAATMTIEKLLNRLKLDCQQVVVELNQQIILRQHHADILIEDGDVIEVIHFVGGG